MPECLELDATLQIVGFYLGWLGNPGHGRELDVGEVKFTGQMLPGAKLVKYTIRMKLVIVRKPVPGIADGSIQIDGTQIYVAKDLRVGLFGSTDWIHRRFLGACRRKLLFPGFTEERCNQEP